MGVRIGDSEALFRVDPLIEKEIVSDKRLSLNQPFWAAEACFVSLAPNIVRLLRNVRVAVFSSEDIFTISLFLALLRLFSGFACIY